MSFRSNVLKLMSGVILVQIVQFLAQPFITRLYSPVEFGQFSSLSNVITLISVFGVFSYEYAIPALKNDIEAIQLTSTAMVIAIPVTIIVGFITTSHYMQQKLFGINLHGLSWFIFLLLFSGIIANIVVNLNNRFKLFGQNAYRSVVCAIISVILQIILGLYNFGIRGLLISLVISSVLGMIILVLPKFKDIFHHFSFNVDLLKDNIHFPKHQFVGGLMNMSSQLLPVIILNMYSSSYIAGNYALAVKVLTIPSLLITGTFSHVFYQEFANKFNNGEDCLKFIVSIWKKLFLMSIIPCLILVIFAPQLFSLYFGKTWQLAGNITQFLAVSTFATIMVSTTSSAFMIIGLSKYFSVLTFIISSFRIIGIIIACKHIYLGLSIIISFEIIFRFAFNYIIYARLKK